MFAVPWLSVVIPTYGARGVELTRKCITTLKATHAHMVPEIIVVSDGDEGEEFEALKALVVEKECGLARIDRMGFAVACNVGMTLSNGALGVALVNNDIEFTENTLQILGDVSMVMNAGTVGCLLLYPDETIQHAGVVFVPVENQPIPGYFDHKLRGQNKLHVDAVVMRDSLVTGALMLVSRQYMERVGNLDERYGFSAEDIDCSLRGIEAGLQSIYVGYTSAIHHEGATRGKTLEEKMKLAPDIAEKESQSLQFFFQRWVGMDWRKYMAR
jgi:Predicted glycosyltransferases